MAGRGPGVSVVIPCYNQARFLADAIESARAQTEVDPDIVVVDDGSQDHTTAVAARYAGVTLIRQPNRGLSAARNAGLRACRGDYVVFLDADDRLADDALATGLARLQGCPDRAMSAGHVRLVAVDGSVLPPPRQPAPPAPVAADYYRELLRRNYIWNPSVAMYRRRVLERLGAFDERLRSTGDYELDLRIARCLPIDVHPAVTAEYRLHGDNMTRDAALLLAESMTVFGRQWPHVRSRPDLRAAWREGRDHTRRYYGERLIDQVTAHLRAGRWRAALRGLQVVARHDTGGLTARVRSGIGRRWRRV